MTENRPRMKTNDLYVFELPEEIFRSLELMVFDSTVTEIETDQRKSLTKADLDQQNETLDLQGGCRTCENALGSTPERKAHYKTDYHRFNIKRKLNNLPPISSDEFDILAENDDVESLSGSDSNSDSEDDLYNEDKDKLSSILEDQIATMRVTEESETGIESHLNTRSPQIYFKSKFLPEDQVLGAYKALFSKSTIENALETIQNWNHSTSSKAGFENPYSALFMVGGGHFAGAIVSHKRLNIKGNMTKGNESMQERAVQFLEHKTFHRYTTRRKQGGSQSAMDNSKGKANSAGSSLRRYNETALRTDIQQLLQQWQPYLKNCENIFIRAKSTSDRKIFLDASACLDKNDARIRSFPFTTKRPTGHELKRAWCHLAYLHINKRPQADVKAKVVAEKFDNQRASKITSFPKVEDPDDIHTRELISLLKKSRAPALISYLRKNDLNANFKLKPQDDYYQTPTMLHYASQQGLKNMVLILLSNLKCDPTVQNSNGKTPWELTKKTEIRQAFQVARHNLGENFTDWNASRIDVPMSREDVDAINEKEKQMLELEKARLMKEELSAAKERQRLEKEARRGPGKILAPQLSSFQQNNNSLSDNQRMRLMREQRARAAEARMKLNANKQ
ncbi:LAME_0E02630g1_1 [Lachancea meyersii CBS 8951]|uniref:LAME_0E02630g1_1 n=1 Tax=Lachancea meyersii CBS 8951 TaxID=1266667 RepID=A0A1G4JGI9_9SACH|nr:LAME_0E02630g1_1 [Lachancea meyersii CBS 8951]